MTDPTRLSMDASPAADMRKRKRERRNALGVNLRLAVAEAYALPTVFIHAKTCRTVAVALRPANSVPSGPSSGARAAGTLALPEAADLLSSFSNYNFDWVTHR